MKISFLVSSLSTNVLVRAYPFAKILQKYHEIEVIGPVNENGIYLPYKDTFRYKSHQVSFVSRKKLYNFLQSFYRPYSSVSGDIIFAFKPKLTSFGSGLLAKWCKKKPLILDIDDWDAEPYYSANWKGRLGRLARFYNPEYCWWYNRLLEPLVNRADQITVVSSFLQKRYGGVLLPQVVDTELFDPSNYDRILLRKKWKVENDFVILFTGNIIKHKGIDTLCEALKLLKKKDILLFLIGPKTDYFDYILKTYEIRIKYLPPQSHQTIPEFLNLADLVVLPQKDMPYARAQIPAKLPEAMAMEKVIIATDMSDLKSILSGCGIVVPSSSPQELAQAIGHSYNNDLGVMAKKAREKCLQSFSFESAEKILATLVT
jgi:glycosyltransferase involved in cell wall biosynthesis